MNPFDHYTAYAFVTVVEPPSNKTLPLLTVTAGGGSDSFLFSSTPSQLWDSHGATVVVITAQRPRLAQAFTMCMLFINWALTIGTTYLTLAVTKGVKLHEGVYILPVTIILTIPALRALYVGSPPFGIFIGRPQTLRS